MTADEDDSLLRYLNRISLQVISLLDLDGAANQARTKIVPVESKTRTKESGLSKPGRIRPRLSHTKQEAKCGRQSATRKITRTRRGQQQQKQQQQVKRGKRLSQESQDELNKNQTPLEQPFKMPEDEKEMAQLEQQQLHLSNCLHDHEHYMASAGQHQQHSLHHSQALTSAGDGVVDSIIHGLDGRHLSSVNLLSLTMGDEMSQSLDSHQAAHNGDGRGDLLTSPNTAHLSPLDPTISQLGGLGTLHNTTSYYITPSSYDDFVGHETTSAVAASTATSSSLNENSPSSPSSAQNYHHQHPATNVLGQTLGDCYQHHQSQQQHHQQHHHQHHQHSQHHSQHPQHQHQHQLQTHQPIQSSTLHHHYQPHLSQQHAQFDSHRTQNQGEHQWLSPLIVHCGGAQAHDQHHQHTQHQRQQTQQPTDHQDHIDYHPNSSYQHQTSYHHYPSPQMGDPHSFQQQQNPHMLTGAEESFITLSPATTNRVTTNTNSSNQASQNSVESNHRVQSFEMSQQTSEGNGGANGNNGNQGSNNNNGTNESQPQYDHTANHHNSHVTVDHHIHQPTSSQTIAHSHLHHNDHGHLHQQQPQQHIQHQSHMMHHHLHSSHMMPTLSPFANGIEPSSVILHDINLASASWASPEDLYSI